MIMNDTIRVIGRNPCSLVDGEGLRDVWYISYCNHNCFGCHNKDELNTGKYLTYEYIINEINENKLTNVTISGGDGLTIQYKETLKLLKLIKEKTNKNVWVYTGYTYDELINSYKKECLKYIDVLVDGKFEIDKRDITLLFRGSENQRIIDVQKSLINNEVVLWKGGEY